jgi:hypothetical protein
MFMVQYIIWTFFVECTKYCVPPHINDKRDTKYGAYHKVYKKNKAFPGLWKIKKTIPPWGFFPTINDCLTNHKVGVSSVNEIEYIT